MARGWYLGEAQATPQIPWRQCLPFSPHISYAMTAEAVTARSKKPEFG